MSLLALLSASYLLQAVNPLVQSNPPADQPQAAVGCTFATFECAADLIQHGRAELGVDTMRAAADMRDVRAQRALGLMLVRGEYLPQDQHAALRWFRSAASRGDRESMTILAKLYERGIGTDVDPAQAAKWRARATR